VVIPRQRGGEWISIGELDGGAEIHAEGSASVTVRVYAGELPLLVRTMV